LKYKETYYAGFCLKFFLIRLSFLWSTVRNKLKLAEDLYYFYYIQNVDKYEQIEHVMRTYKI